MFATKVRVRPCSALWYASSDGRRTTTVLSSTAIVRSRWIVRLISPFGPLTVIFRPSTWAVTPWGSGTGRLPIRDIGGLLPDHREQLAAHVGGARFAVRHDALGRAEDGHPQPVLHARDLARLHVAPEPRRRHPHELADDGGVVVVLEVQSQQPVSPVVQDLEVLDVVVVTEDARDLDLQLRHRHVHPPVARLAGVAHTGQHVGDGISNVHLAFRSLPDRKSTRLNSSHLVISYAVFCLKKKKTTCKSYAQYSVV